MIRNVVQEIGGVGLYGVVSICLFVTVFTGAFLRACLLNKTQLNRVSRLPLDDAESNGGSTHE